MDVKACVEKRRFPAAPPGISSGFPAAGLSGVGAGRYTGFNANRRVYAHESTARRRDYCAQ